MPRDDLTIDMTKNMRMPISEHLDATGVIEEWCLRASNMPGEATFTFTEIEAKDREIAECKAVAEDLDSKLQRSIKTHGSHYINSKEDSWRAAIREKQQRCEVLSREKTELLNNLIRNFEKHVRTLDLQIKSLYDRSEPGFDDPDELPSLVRPSAANSISPQASVAPSRPTGTAPSALSAGATTPAATTPILQSVSQGVNRSAAALNCQLRISQSQQNHASSAPATPAASIMMGRNQRESSAGPAIGSIPKRVSRQNTSLNTSIRITPSGLARQTSIGPGTPKAGAAFTAPVSLQPPSRAGSVDPKTSGAGSSKGSSSRKSIQLVSSAPVRKKPPSNKGGPVRVKRTEKSPGSDAVSELSDADSGSGEDQEAMSRATPRPGGGAGVGGGVEGGANIRGDDSGGFTGGVGATTTMVRRDADGDLEMEEEEGNDDQKYCLCQNVSFGNMVACDNDECPYEWFHWHCVGLKSEPTGTWYCPVCKENGMSKGKKTK